MAKTLKDLGIRRFLDEVYQAEGGYDFLKESIPTWRRAKLAEHFGVSRETLRSWINIIQEEENHG